MNKTDTIETAKTRRRELAHELAGLDPIEDAAITTGRLRMRMLDGLLARCEGAATVNLSDDERALLRLDG